MEIRMWEYDAQIALMNKEYQDGVLYVKFPDSAVIYLRSNSNTPDELKICICVGEKGNILRNSDFKSKELYVGRNF